MHCSPAVLLQVSKQSWTGELSRNFQLALLMFMCKLNAAYYLSQTCSWVAYKHMFIWSLHSCYKLLYVAYLDRQDVKSLDVSNSLCNTHCTQAVLPSRLMKQQFAHVLLCKPTMTCCCRWQSRLAHHAVQLVGQEDEDDLYFESGQHSQEILKLMVWPSQINMLLRIPCVALLVACLVS